MRRLRDQKRRGEIHREQGVPLFERDAIERTLTGATGQMHDVIDATPFADDARDAIFDRRRVGDVETRHAHRRTTGNLGERQIRRPDAHRALAQARDHGASETPGGTRDEHHRGRSARCGHAACFDSKRAWMPSSIE